MSEHFRTVVCGLLEQIHELQADPYAKSALALSIQETIAYERMELEAAQQSFLADGDEGAANTARTLLDALRQIADSLAFTYLPTKALRPESELRLDPLDDDFELDLEALRMVFEHGGIGILHRLTYCLPEACMSVCNLPDGARAAIRRDFIFWEPGPRGGPRFDAIQTPAQFVSHVGTLNEMLREIGRSGYVFSEVETGLYYLVGMRDRLEDPSHLFEFAKDVPLTFFNVNRMDRIGYWPMPLLLDDVNLTWEFLIGRLGIVVAVDNRRLKALFAERGLTIEATDMDEGYAFALRRAGIADQRWGFPNISYYFFGRLGGEFVGLPWFVDAAADMVAWAEKTSRE